MRVYSGFHLSDALTFFSCHSTAASVAASGRIHIDFEIGKIIRRPRARAADAACNQTPSLHRQISRHMALQGWLIMLQHAAPWYGCRASKQACPPGRLAAFQRPQAVMCSRRVSASTTGGRLNPASLTSAVMIAVCSAHRSCCQLGSCSHTRQVLSALSHVICISFV